MLKDVGPTEDWKVSSEPIKDQDLRRDLEAVLVRADEALGVDPPEGRDVADVAEARARLDAATTALTDSLRSGASGTRARGVGRDAVIDLLVDAREVGGRVTAAQEAARIAAFARVRDAMGLLRGVTTVGEMLERAPMTVARLGFDRAFVSSIKDSYFVPQTCFMNGDTEWEQATVRAGAEQPRRLDRNLLETEMVRRRQPIRVVDAQNDPRVHREIAEVSMSRSYVAAPVIVQDRVVGFVHSDYFEQRKLVGPMDADVLWMFSEAFGFAFERIAYGERIASLRASFLQTMAVAEEDFIRAVDEEVALDDRVVAPVEGDVRRAPMPVASIGGGRPELADVLTKRELEVLRLMAAGATNDGIATRLVISHGTAKTHVKHILRKLRASNRAEAVSRYFQLEQGEPGAGR